MKINDNSISNYNNIWAFQLSVHFKFGIKLCYNNGHILRVQSSATVDLKDLFSSLIVKSNAGDYSGNNLKLWLRWSNR